MLHRRASLRCQHHPGPTQQQLIDAFGPYAMEIEG